MQFKDNTTIEERLMMYRDCMDKIVHRMEVVKAFGQGERDAIYLHPTVECIYLQLRIVLEMIAAASFGVNKVDMEKHSIRARRKWHAGDVLEAIEIINPDYFYPKPVREVHDPNSHMANVEGYRGELKDFEGEYLTREQFMTLYGISSSIIHSEMLQGKSCRDVKECLKLVKQAGDWHEKIVNLLTCHYFKLSGADDCLYLAHTVGEHKTYQVVPLQRMSDVNVNSPREKIISTRVRMLKNNT